LDLNQAAQLLSWLDEEHRKDKALLMALQSQVDVHKAQLNEQSRQLQAIQASLSRIEGQLPKLNQLDNSLQSMRSEFGNLVAKQSSERDGLEEKHQQSERQEAEAIARIVRQVQDRVDALGTYENTITVLREEDAKLRSRLTEVFDQVSEIAKRLDMQQPRTAQLEQDVGVFRDSIAEHRVASENLGNRLLQLKAELDALGSRLETKVDQTQSALEELRERRRIEVDETRIRQQEQGRRIDELEQEVGGIRAPIGRWAVQIAEFAEEFERNRKTIYDLRELERTVRQQGKEMIELQRITAERQRTEMREWQDQQVRVDEEQNARLARIEAANVRVMEALQKLEDSIAANQSTIQDSADELWQAWSAYLQGQVSLTDSIIVKRGKG